MASMPFPARDRDPPDREHSCPDTPSPRQTLTGKTYARPRPKAGELIAYKFQNGETQGQVAVKTKVTRVLQEI
jgi:hypothetical protein